MHKIEDPRQKVGYASKRGGRLTMENFTKLEPDFMKDWGFFGVFNGYGSRRDGNEELSEKLLGSIKSSVNSPHNMNESKTLRMKKGVEQALRNGTSSSVVCAVISKDSVIVANYGGSKAALAYSGNVCFETGSRCRKNKNHTESRDMHDGTRSTYPVSSDKHFRNEPMEPDIHVLERNGLAEFLILASDGILHVIEVGELIEHVRYLLTIEDDPTEICKRVIDVCFRKGCHNNMAIVLIVFPNAKQTNENAIKKSKETIEQIKKSVWELLENNERKKSIFRRNSTKPREKITCDQIIQKMSNPSKRRAGMWPSVVYVYGEHDTIQRVCDEYYQGKESVATPATVVRKPWDEIYNLMVLEMKVEPPLKDGELLRNRPDAIVFTPELFCDIMTKLTDVFNSSYDSSIIADTSKEIMNKIGNNGERYYLIEMLCCRIADFFQKIENLPRELKRERERELSGYRNYKPGSKRKVKPSHTSTNQICSLVLQLSECCSLFEYRRFMAKRMYSRNESSIYGTIDNMLDFLKNSSVREIEGVSLEVVLKCNNVKIGEGFLEQNQDTIFEYFRDYDDFKDQSSLSNYILRVVMHHPDEQEKRELLQDLVNTKNLRGIDKSDIFMIFWYRITEGYVLDKDILFYLFDTIFPDEFVEIASETNSDKCTCIY